MVKTCVYMYLRPNLSLTKINASPHKSMQVDLTGWPNETQVELKSKTCVNLRVRLARALCILVKICTVRFCHMHSPLRYDYDS